MILSSVIFEQVDHPLIIIAQIIVAFFLFRLFFAIRKSGQPLPQIIAGLAFGVLANLIARSMHESWFWVADIVQYVTLAAVVIAAVRAAHRAQAEAAHRPGAPVIVADLFDRIETKVTWTVGLVLAGVLTYYCVDMYMKLQHTDAQVVAAATNAKTEATVQFSQQLSKTEQNQTALIAAVTSISATQNTIIANQRKNSTAILESQKGVKQLVSKQNQAVKKTLNSAVIQARPIEPKKPDAEPEEEKQNLWKRFKGMFHSSARRDTLSSYIGEMPGDTLVFQ